MMQSIALEPVPVNDEKGLATRGRPLHGRARELAELEAALARAEDGHGGIFLLSGEGGIGKTRLAEAVAELAEARGGAVLWGRGWETHGVPALGPWGQLLRAADVDLPPSGSDDPELELLHRSSGMLSLIRRLTCDRPLLLVFDDLHACDVASLSILARVAPDLRGLPVLLVGTYRELEARRQPVTATLIARAARSGIARPLGRLDAGAVTDWLAAALGQGAARRLAADVLATTEGHPLFVEAIVQLVVARGEGAMRSLPDTVRAAALELVERVPDAARPILDAAAVLGRTAAIDAVARICGRPIEEIFAAVEAGVAAGVLTPAPRPSSPIRFAHVLVREAIYQALPAARRTELHAAALRALSRLHVTDVDEHLAELAHHAFEGAATGSWAEAAELAARAGAQALACAAFDAAAEHYERALIALDRAESADGARRAELLCRLGIAEIRIGQARRGRERCERSAALGEKLGRTDLVARAALAFGLELVPGRVDLRLVALLEQALAGARLGESLRIQVTARLADALASSPDRARPVTLAREAIAAARALGDRRVLAQTLATAWAALLPTEPLGELRRLCDELAALAAALGDPFLGMQARGWLALLALGRGEPDSAGLELRLLDELAAELDVPQQALRAATLHLVRASVLDDAAAIADDERRVLALAAQVDDPRGLIALHASRVIRAEIAGDHAAAGAALDVLEGILAGEPSWTTFWRPLWRASVHAAAGRLDEARVLVAETSPAVLDAALGPGFLARQARVAVALGDRDWMTRLADRLAPYGCQLAFNPFAPVCEGPVALHRGWLALGLGRPEEAVTFFRQAVARCERAGYPALAAQARRALGEATQVVAVGEPPVARSRPFADESPPRLERDGELWRLRHGGREVHLRGTKGVAYLALLLAEPGRPFHVGDLVAEPSLGAGLSGAQAREAGLTVGGLGDAGAHLDAQARAAYRRRLTTLDDAESDAEDRGDAAAVARIREERAALADELARAVGLGGRGRRAGAASERARINVQRRIRDVLTRIAEVDGAIARYLERRVKTGAFCSFEP